MTKGRINTNPTSPVWWPTGPPCDECGALSVRDYPLDSRNLCLGCLDEADPMWREKKLGIKVIDNPPVTLADRVDARLNELKAENAKLREFVQNVADGSSRPQYTTTQDAQKLLNELEATA